MNYRQILVTGGAGFVGSSIAIRLKRDNPTAVVTVLDNLKRRGTELALSRLETNGVQFHHGDIRVSEDLKDVGTFDLMIECSAESSVHAGYQTGTEYLVDTNLLGTIHCLNAARTQGADIIFLSSSRVYPIKHLRNLPLDIDGNRFELASDYSQQGCSYDGITEDFAIDGPRSLYGATKLCSEILLTEYNEMYGLKSVVNRCGVITGPWQLGVVDQGFFSLWAARHYFKGNLSYIGFSGNGFQVRDVLHVDDLYLLLHQQLQNLDDLSGQTFNIGGGRHISISLAELTTLCQQICGHKVPISNDPSTRPADIPWYITDSSRANEVIGWEPKHTVEEILEDIFSWLTENKLVLEPFF